MRVAVAKAFQRRVRLALRKHRRLPAFLLLAAGLVLFLGVLAQLWGAGSGPVAAGSVEAPDADNDRVPDVIENAVLGSDPGAIAPAGTLPEAWLTKYGLDAGDGGLANRTAPYPRPPESPAAYGVEGLPREDRMTYYEVYAFGRPADWDESRDGPWDNGLDPRRWDVNESRVPYAWLIRNGLDPFDVASLDARAEAPGVTWTVREAYERGLWPASADGDKDGLEDVSELSLGTNPRKTSTAGTGIADGWLVRNGLDATNPAVADQDPDNDGLVNREEFQASMRLRPAQTLAGGGLNPLKQSTAGGPIPDGWLARMGLDPFDADVAAVVTESRLDENGTVVARLTVLDEYRVNRPPAWNETRNGPWFGGTDPASNDTDEDGVQDLTEILGWRIVIGDEPRHVVSDPTRPDSDADGLTDAEEERGRRGDLQFGRTNPSVADTDADGLGDGEEVGVVPVEGRRLPPLDPTHPDTDRDGLLDGDEVEYWTGRFRAYADDPAATYEWGPTPPPRARDVFAKEGLTPAAALERLLPAGDVDGDGQANVLDTDSDADGLADGWEAKPELYRETPYASEHPRARTDPANLDTDTDTLPDGWEMRYGVHDPQLGGWNLNPAAWSSLGDGKSDADQDLDKDGTTWYSYHRTPAGLTATAHVFAATNRIEYEANSDPNKYSSSPDGIADGWKVFWGTQYVGLSAEDRGEVYPGAPGDLRLPDDRPLPRIGSNDDQAWGAYRYVRVLPVNGSNLLPWEKVERTNPSFLDISQRPAPYRIVAGTVQLSYKGVSENMTNPYLDDTDADGASDAWESTWSRLGTPRQRVSPVQADGEADPDGDGVRNAEESSRGTSPYAADSDLGGAPDGVEAAIGTDPLDPLDDQRTIDPDTDNDGDGVPDTVELLGRAVGPTSVVRTTDPRHPDTDRDGLLDGKSLSIVLGRKLSATNDAAILNAYRDLGLIVRNFTDGTADVVGEETLGSDPSLLSTPGDGVPDGWLALYNLPTDRSSSVFSKYSFGRPAWWNETLDGVWLWGLRPSDAPAPDHDKDGLDDANGEDPLPYSNRRNVLPAGDPQESGISAAERLRRARQYGDLPPPGTVLPPRPRLNVTLETLPDPLAANGTLRYTGNVSIDGTDERVANVTVVLSLGSRGLALGATVTNATGVFNGTILLAPKVPADNTTVGIPAFGRADGTGVHENPAALMSSIDPRQPVRLFAWAYNTSPYATGRQGDLHAFPNGTKVVGVLGNDSHPQFRTLRLPTTLAVTNLTLEGERAIVNVTLTDGLGRPVKNASINGTAGWNVTARTDADGKVTLNVTLAAGLGPRDILFEYNGTDALLATNATHRVFLRASPVVTVDNPRVATRVNASFSIAGRYALPNGTPIQDATLDLALGDLRATTVTNRTGAFRFIVQVPLAAPLGNVSGLVQFRGNDTHDPASAPVSATIVGRPAWNATPLLAPLDAPGNVTGTLLDARGNPVPGMPAALLFDGRVVATGFTDVRGRVSLAARIAEAGPGTHTLRLRAQDPVVGEADQPVLVTLYSPTKLDASAGEALRGRGVDVQGRLVDVLSRPLAGRPVDVELLGHRHRAVTGPDGRWSVHVPLGRADALGSATATATHEGSSDGVFQASAARVPVLVRDAATLRLAGDGLTLSAPALDGVALTLTGDPLPGREVRIGGAGGEAVAITDADGRFHLIPPIAARQPLGPAEFTLHVPGERLLAPYDAAVTLHVRDQGRLQARAPAFVIERGVLDLDVRVTDSRGLPVPDARVLVILNGARLGEPVAPGLVRVPVPDAVRAGNHDLRLEAVSGLVTAPAVDLKLEVRRATQLVLEAADPVLPARDGAVRVRLTSQGAPLVDETLTILAGDRVLRVTTDANGHAAIPLSSLARGVSELDVRYLGTPTEGPAALAVHLRQGEVAYRADADTAWWAVAVLLLVLAAAAVLVIRSRRGAVATAIAQQARILRSDRADVKALYASYLEFLRLAGLDEASAEHMTFRDVAARVVVVGPDTADAIETLAEAYSRAAYAPQLLDHATLAAAGDALLRLSEHTREDEAAAGAPGAGEVPA